MSSYYSSRSVLASFFTPIESKGIMSRIDGERKRSSLAKRGIKRKVQIFTFIQETKR